MPSVARFFCVLSCETAPSFNLPMRPPFAVLSLTSSIYTSCEWPIADNRRTIGSIVPTRFGPGDRVHLPRLGTGVVREIRSSGRCLVEIKGRTLLVSEAQLERADPPPRPGRSDEVTIERDREPRFPHAAVSLDLHGMTVEEAIAALDRLINDALLASHVEVRVIHGKSGGRIKHAVHARLRELAPVRSFRTDPRNPGVTIVSL